MCLRSRRLSVPDVAFFLFKSLNPSSASPSLPLTKSRSPARAPNRLTLVPLLISPITQVLIRIFWKRVVSPPARGQPSLSVALESPFKNASSHFPVQSTGIAKLTRQQRGSPPMAATSLAARARLFHPTASGGCKFFRKCLPSRNQSVVKIVS